MSSAVYLWKTFRAQAEQHSGVSQTVFGFSPESVFALRPECCSESARNPVRLHPGMLFGLPRNTHKDRRHGANGIRVRVIEYTLEGVAGAEPIYRLVTSILDPSQAPAQELAALYHERWEIETTLDELKTHLRGSKIVLRSKTPELVRQEFYGLMMTHFAVRGLMHEAALQDGEDPDRLSFIHAVRVVRRKLPRFVAIPPSGEKSVP